MQPHIPHQKGEPGDFGIPPDVAAEQAKHRGEDHLGRPAGDKMLGSGDSVREHGVGARGGHPGKGSGGELDTDFVLETPAPGRIDEPGKNENGEPNIGGTREVAGRVSTEGVIDDKQSGGGVANTHSRRDLREDDSFASEVSFDEADGEDMLDGGGGGRT